MKIENEKIIQATEDELYSYWLSRGWDDVYSFPEYMQRMKDAGCEVIAEISPTVFDQITASTEALAPTYVFKEWDPFSEMFCWRSLLVKEDVKFASQSEAVKATIDVLCGE